MQRAGGRIQGALMRDRSGQGQNEPEDLTEVMIEGSKSRMRVKALILVAVFLFASLAPPPWSVFAPLLFFAPIVYALAERLRRRPGQSRPEEAGDRQPEPYSSPPRHAGDPRRYRPIE